MLDPNHELYCFVLGVSQRETVAVGSVGEINLPTGWIYYVGRAEYGWASRVKRFAKPDYSPHWHIDYLVDASATQKETVFVFNEPASRECELASWFLERKRYEPLHEGVGASDCKNGCDAHAFKSMKSPKKTCEVLFETDFSLDVSVRFEETHCSWIN